MQGASVTLFECRTCGKSLPETNFSPHKECKSGFDLSRCKPCKKSAADWSATPLNKRIYNRIKARAKRKSLDFNLELSDIVIPECCPVFNKPFIYGDTDWTYSVDRIKSELGYIKGNINIISNKANRYKNNATKEELEKVLEYLNKCEV